MMRGVLDSLLMDDEGDAQVQIVKLYHAVVLAAAQLGGMLFGICLHVANMPP